MPSKLEVAPDNVDAQSASWETAEALGRVSIGTADLRDTAVDRVGKIVRNPDEAQAFIDQYENVQWFRRNLERLPFGVKNPLVVEAITAIDTLRAAQAQNIMADTELSARHGNDRQVASESWLLDGLHTNIVQEVLGRLEQ